MSSAEGPVEEGQSESPAAGQAGSAFQGWAAHVPSEGHRGPGIADSDALGVETQAPVSPPWWHLVVTG